MISQILLLLHAVLLLLLLLCVRTVLANCNKLNKITSALLQRSRSSPTMS